MSRRDPMYQMARHNDVEDITRLLDQGVDPAADEERAGVRLIIVGQVDETRPTSLSTACG
jgi:hypothetical protein